MPQPSPALHTHGRQETVLAAIDAATEYLLHIAQRQTEAAARGDLEEVEQLNPKIQIILDNRSYLVREFARLHMQASSQAS
jgi:hypothetical protein